MRRSSGSGIVGTALRLLACKNGLASGCGQVSVRICVNSRFYPPEFETEPPPEPEPDRVQAFGEPSSPPSGARIPDRVLTSSNYTVEVYARTAERNGCQIENREYCVSDGVTASTYRATGFGNCCFFEQAVTAPGTIRYYSFQSDEWVCESLAEGSFSSPVVVVEL